MQVAEKEKGLTGMAAEVIHLEMHALSSCSLGRGHHVCTKEVGFRYLYPEGKTQEQTGPPSCQSHHNMDINGYMP